MAVRRADEWIAEREKQRGSADPREKRLMTERDAQLGISWETPPVVTRRSWATPILERLTEEPGKWARIGRFDKPNSATSTAHQLRKKIRDGKLPPGRWDFVAVKTDEGGSDLYACFLGPEKAVKP